MSMSNSVQTQNFNGAIVIPGNSAVRYSQGAAET